MLSYNLDNYKIHRFVEKKVPPRFIADKALGIRLHPVEGITRGVLHTKTLVSSALTPNDVIKETKFIYQRDENGLAIKRDEITRWHLESGELGQEILVNEKVYDTALKKRIEAEKRRRNVIDYLMSFTGQLGVQAEAESFFKTNAAAVRAYRDEGISDFAGIVENSPEAWLDNSLSPEVSTAFTSIRQAVLWNLLPADGTEGTT